MDSVLKTSGLTKMYKNKAVVRDVSINVHKGDIYGFIGRNGAGKTTLIRMVLGLARPSNGNIELFGSNNLEKSRRKIGAIVENPAFYPNMTAKQNLEIQAILLGVKDRSIVDSLLEKVGLTDTGKKKAKNFSLGMKQRLGIALSLLGEPEFLCLDEPINGLDPSGIKEIRDLLKFLNQKFGITVLISSHILSELSRLATRYGIINDGQLIDEFSADELEQRCQSSLIIKVEDAIKAAEVIEKEVKVRNYKIQDKNTIELFEQTEKSGEINKILTRNDITVNSISKSQVDLEEYFLKITEGK
ncbi:MAG: ABC transporter ATP-binding protein [Lactobacillales bacterium]|nr:ABC transporter ATP-binding protein [Lactobacillales bacterium]